ncbi:hypothetical protein C0V78_07225 [Novosphingobium sp. TH158]|nr:hypothetical protein C0V78_07225 [Novosphingobium sp. TH158]
MAPCDLAAYFTGPVLGHLLRMRGQVALHGGFVSHRGQGVGVLAGKGGGKSTLVAALAKTGVAVLADDVGALARDGHGGWQVASGYPCLRVWDDTQAAVGFQPDELAGPVVTFEAKHYVALDEAPLRFEANSRPLRALVVLGERQHREDAVIKRLAPGPAIAALLANVYAPRAGGIAMRGRDLACAGELSQSITICKVSLPEGIGWLRQHAARLLDRVLGHG